MHQKSGNVPVTVLRDHKEVTLTLKVPEHKKESEVRDQDFMFELGPEIAMAFDNEMIAFKAQQEAANALREHRDEIQRAMDQVKDLKIEINLGDFDGGEI